MEGIVKVNSHTAQAIATLTVESFILQERLADEGEGEQIAMKAIAQMKATRLYETKDYIYLYIPDQTGRRSLAARPTPQPVLTGQNTL